MAINVGTAGWTDEAFNSSERHAAVFFHVVQVKNNHETTQQGRPIYMPKVFITKMPSGDPSLVIDRPMREMDKEEYPVPWARFEQKKSSQIAGTPLSAWPALNETQCAEFRAMNIFTVDQFSELPDSIGHKIMGFNQLRAKAKAFINAGQDSALADKLNHQDKEIAELRAQLAAMANAPKKAAKPTKHKWTDEQRQAARERMIATNAAKAAQREAA